MSPADLIQKLRAYCDKMIATAEKKNADYTGSSADPFANFTMVERIEVCPTETGMFVRFTDKFMRVASFIKKGVLAVKDETVEDTLLDLACYCLLMAAYISSKKAGTITEPVALSSCEVHGIEVPCSRQKHVGHRCLVHHDEASQVPGAVPIPHSSGI